MEASGDLGESSSNEAVRIQIEIQIRGRKSEKKSGETKYKKCVHGVCLSRAGENESTGGEGHVTKIGYN